MRRAVPGLLLVLGSAHASLAQEYGVADLAAAFGSASIVIEASQHACHSFEVFIAETNAQRQRGLMFVRELPPRSGMLFVYRDAAVHSMWMKNTYISLDMLFIRSDGTVSNVVRNTEPLSLRSIFASEAVSFVLELNAGVSERLNIDSGSRLLLD